MAPEQIIILIAVPLNFTEFSLRVCISDWLAKFHQPHLTPAEQQDALRISWEEEYHPQVASPFQDLIQQARRLGVEVLTRATIADIGKASAADKEVIIIFSHWKGPEILAADLRENLDRKALEHLVGCQEGALARRIQVELGKLDAPSKQALSMRMLHWFCSRISRSPRSIQDILSAATSETLAEKAEAIDEIVESRSISQARCRDSLDLLLNGFITPGNRLELFDGMFSKEAVDRAISKDFKGVLDLTMCASTYLSDYISARRRQDIRTVQFPTVQKFAWAARCVGVTLEIAVREELSYQKARLLATQVFTNELMELARGRKFTT